MTPVEFKARYLATLEPYDILSDDPYLGMDKFVTFDATVVATFELGDSDTQLLVEIGLPESAAPFLTFGGRWALQEFDDLPGTSFIGSDGGGNPICIDLRTRGEVALYDHDSGMARHKMNGSVMSLAACLLAYREAESAATLAKVISSIDATALSTGSWWEQNLAHRDRHRG